jgi:hypothetical protein
LYAGVSLATASLEAGLGVGVLGEGVVILGGESPGAGVGVRGEGVETLGGRTGVGVGVRGGGVETLGGRTGVGVGVLGGSALAGCRFSDSGFRIFRVMASRKRAVSLFPSGATVSPRTSGAALGAATTSASLSVSISSG